ncbi:MAG: hypothetical protein WCE75_09660 [Terracidiphilus sp.]
MKSLGWSAVLACAVLAAAGQAWAQKDAVVGAGQAFVTVLPAHAGETAAGLTSGELSLKLNGKPAEIVGWVRVSEEASPTEIVLLIDGGARMSLGEQMGAITEFVRETPSNAKIALAYMDGGRAVIAAPFSADPAVVLRGLHLPGGSAGSSGSPYFCLSDLAKRWPSSNTSARRVAVMITDGLDPYQQRFDPEDPYMLAAIADSVRAGLAVYSMYWHGQGQASSTEPGVNAGQSLLHEVTDATGGVSYGQGMSNPVSFDPFFHDLRTRLRNQYLLQASARFNGKPAILTLKLHVGNPAVKAEAPQQIYLRPVTAQAR